MGKKYVKTDLDRARDELFSHIQRCDVLEAADEDRDEWLNDTLAYMAERYPQLPANERKELETMARRYIKPIVPHGKGATARNRQDWQGEAPESDSGDSDAADEASGQNDSSNGSPEEVVAA